MEIVGLEPRRSDLARGIVIARASRTLDGTAQRALWEQLGAAGITEPSEAGTDDEDDHRARQWLAAPWLPPAAHEVEAQRAAFVAAAETYGLEAIWCVKVETGIDGVAWLEIAVEEARKPVEDDEDDDAEDDDAEAPPEEVLYAAPDAPALPVPAEEPDDDEDDDDEVEAEDISSDVMLESHWRNGVPPLEHSVPFPLERYPEIIDDYDWESFGIAVKLAGPNLAGEESVINAFFALWLSVYQDERSDEFEPFQRADVVHDRRHRSALMWVERFNVPATAPEQVHFLLWVIAQINEILPIAWARFDSVDDAVKSRAVGGIGAPDEPFVLAGNPLADRFRRHGEEAALSWAVAQSAWSKRELAGMLVEVALEHDPDDPGSSIVAERLLRRALAFDASSDASGYLAIVLVRQRRLAEAISLARAAPSRDVRLLVVGETAEHMPGELDAAIELLDPETLEKTEPEELCDLVGGVARHAPAYLSSLLARLPEAPLVPHLYNTSFSVEKPQALAILRKVLSLPVPARDAGEARTAYVMAWNNACIHAHALRDYKLAVELGEGGQPYGPENPYIYHSAACAYAASGEIDLALDQVAKAIEHEYEHAEKMETDPDLAALQPDPRFAQLFVEWRTRRHDLN